MSDVLSLQMLNELPTAMGCFSKVSCNSDNSCRSNVSGSTAPEPTGPTTPTKLDFGGFF